MNDHPARLEPVDTGPELRVEHLTKRYGANTVVDDLTFTVHPGRVTGFLGPNGSGKSTTMKILLDLASADAGHATIGGVRYRDIPDPAATVGALLESNAFHPGRSGRNHLRILAAAFVAGGCRETHDVDVGRRSVDVAEEQEAAAADHEEPAQPGMRAGPLGLNSQVTGL